MTLQTNPAERREMVQAISERLGSPAVYLRTPTYAYRIGGLTVERDGSIISDDDALLEALRPMLIERGWLTDAEASVTKTEPTEQDSEITQMELSFPVEDWTVPQLNNLLRTLYSNQYILRRMMRGDALYIERLLVERLLAALRKIGIHKAALVAFSRNQAGNTFWEKMGFTVRTDLTYRNRALTELRRIDT